MFGEVEKEKKLTFKKKKKDDNHYNFCKLNIIHSVLLDHNTGYEQKYIINLYNGSQLIFEWNYLLFILIIISVTSQYSVIRTVTYLHLVAQ